MIDIRIMVPRIVTTRAQPTRCLNQNIFMTHLGIMDLCHLVLLRPRMVIRDSNMRPLRVPLSLRRPTVLQIVKPLTANQAEILLIASLLPLDAAGTATQML